MIFGRRRRLLKQLRANIAAMGHGEIVSKLDDEQLEKIATRFGTLEQIVALTDPWLPSDHPMKFAADFAAMLANARPQPQPTLSREQVQATKDEPPKRTAERGSVRTHDGAGELIRLRGGPMDDFLVREGAPVLQPGWPGGKGAYTRSDPPDREDDGTEIATWVPA